MIELLLIVSLSLEPSFTQAIETVDPVIERKRSHKRRRKIRKPIKGLRR